MATARGQITIVDLNDAKSLNLYLGSNYPATQIFNRENSSYTPNYAISRSALTITPELFVSGTPTSVINQVRSVPTYKINGSTNLSTFGGVVAQTSPYTLTINKNLASSQLVIECELVYVDPTTLVQTTIKANHTITKTENAGQLICAVATAPKGTIFRQGGSSSLQARCDMWRGSQIDDTNVSYQWHKLNISGTYEALTSAKSYGCTGYNTNILTIPSSAVLNFETFKCDIKDTDTTSGTYNTTVSDTISFADLTDPYKVEVISPAGDKLVNGQGSLTITAEVWQAGNKIEDTSGSKFDYTWRCYDKDGRQVTSWGTSGTKTGRSITITPADVTIKGTFVCEIATK